MEKDNLLWEIPYGMRDFLPGEAAQKRETENRLVGLFTAWGYEEVVTPVMEYLDTLATGNGDSLEEHIFKFLGRDNRTLALRHEMTTPIARLATGRLRDKPLPLKLSYISNVYRYEQVQTGRRCEFYQAGVEFLGDGGAAADAEVIALAMESLRTVGITDFRLCLGHVDFAGGLLASCGLTTKETEKIQAAIENKNLVKLKNLTEKLNLSPARQSALAQIPLLYGDESVLERAEQLVANPQSSAALANLRQIYALVQKYGSAEHIAFDLGLIRDFAYYTGPVWEIYVPTLGFPLCGGGRYDRLLAKFGRDLPATGFALGIERIMLATGQIC